MLAVYNIDQTVIVKESLWQSHLLKNNWISRYFLEKRCWNK
ncbi:hypothetical protein LC2W_0720 [Lacticaseibacillus paracasei]|nr:hypothetical protein LCAZH_0587 [Lacticaseibacillus paracasei]AEA53054.1 hypothetical protein LC2W_0720 [Lacticaseibacillus paracasei]AEA56219.1 hypothetical protein LCBD_0721 [Lacticaseibacillus paracasei]